jgi:hypothetical protein
MNVRTCMGLYCSDSYRSTRVSEDVSNNQSRVAGLCRDGKVKLLMVFKTT